FTKNGTINIRNKKWADCFEPLEADGASYVDTAYTKAYLRHLTISGELLGLQIASIHNLAFYLWLVKEARKHIIAGDYTAWKATTLDNVSRRL
ncbi:MAG: tRNA-guanine transglycosylase, partial [Paludibacteraceae bacterium]|nr:tRNA-guanine transglycosylase [Paludibacteraceae bacterium]